MMKSAEQMEMFTCREESPLLYILGKGEMSYRARHSVWWWEWRGLLSSGVGKE